MQVGMHVALSVSHRSRLYPTLVSALPLSEPELRTAWPLACKPQVAPKRAAAPKSHPEIAIGSVAASERRTAAGWRRPRRCCALRTSPTTPSPSCCSRTSRTASGCSGACGRRADGRAAAATGAIAGAAAALLPGRLCSLPCTVPPRLRRELRDAVQAGSLSPECALANATLVPDLLVLHAAAYKALAAAKRGELRTRSLHAELVFSLSGSKHVSGAGLERLRRRSYAPNRCWPSHTAAGRASAHLCCCCLVAGMGVVCASGARPESATQRLLSQRQLVEATATGCSAAVPSVPLLVVQIAETLGRYGINPDCK